MFLFKIEYRFLFSLFISLLIEVPILLWLLKNEKRFGFTNRVLLGSIATITTIPFVWFVFPAFISSWLISLILAELFVFGIEALFYKLVFRITFKKASIVSIICNVSSLIGGYLFQRIFYTLVLNKY